MNGDYDLARKILGNDFISPEDIMKGRRSKRTAYSKEQLRQLSTTMPSEEVFEWCYDVSGILLVPGPPRPMSLLDVSNLRRDYVSDNIRWRVTDEDGVRSEKVNPGWIMLRKEPVPGTIGKSWCEQRALLSEDEVIPNIAEVVWCMLVYRMIRRVNLFSDNHVRTATCVLSEKSLVVGHFGGTMFVSTRGFSGFKDLSSLGLAAMRKL